MNTFTMTVEYIDAETGEMMTDEIAIDDFGYHPAEPFQPEPAYSNDECPW
jgi:hypothetical protein